MITRRKRKNNMPCFFKKLDAYALKEFKIYREKGGGVARKKNFPQAAVSRKERTKYKNINELIRFVFFFRK